MEDEHTQKGSKQMSLENLSRDELLTKCRSLLGFLKKAKSAKDDAVTELEKVRVEKAKIIRQMEDEKRKDEEQMEVLNEMLSSLTENKMDLTTKNESLHRQLNVQISEVESLRNVEKSLLEERNGHLKEIEILKVAGIKMKQNLEQFREERGKESEQLNQWENEKLMFTDRIESLEAQLSQTEVLKNKCKKLLSEKEELQVKIQEKSNETQTQKSFETEKKALEIVHNELKSQKIVLEDKYHTCMKENESLKKKILEVENLSKSFSLKEEENRECRQEVETSMENLAKMEKRYEAVMEEKKGLVEEVELLKCENRENKEETEKIMFAKEEMEKLKNDLEEKNKDLENKLRIEIEKLTNSSERQNELEIKLRYLEEENIKLQEKLKERNFTETDSESELSYDQLQAEMKSSLVIIEELKKENGELKMLYKNISSLFSMDDLLYDQVIAQLSNLKLNSQKTSADFEELKFSTSKLVSLVSHLFCLNSVSNNDCDDLVFSVNSTYDTLNIVIEEFRNSNLENLCNKCFSDIESVYSSISKLEDISTSLVTGENMSLEDALSKVMPVECNALTDLRIEELLSTPLSEIIANLSNICLILSKFFKFELCSNSFKISDLNITFKENFVNILSNIFNELAKCRELRDKLELYVQKETKLTAKIEEHDSVISSYQTDIKNLKEEFNKMEKVKISLDESIKDLTREYEDCKTKLKEKEEEADKRDKEGSSLECCLKDVENLRLENESLKEKLDSTESNLLEKTQELDGLNIRIVALENDLKESHCSCKNLESDLKELKSEYNKLEIVKESLKDEMTQLENDCKQKSIDIESLSNESLSLKNQLSSVHAENKELKNQLSKLENEASLKCQNNESLLEKYDKLVSGNDELLNENENLKLKLEMMENELGKVKSDLDEISRQREKLYSERDELLKRCDLIIKENESFKHKNESISFENENLKVVVEESNMKMKGLESEMKVSSKEIESLNDSLIKSNGENDILTSENESHKERIINLENELKNLMEVQESTERDYRVLKSDLELIRNETEEKNKDAESWKEDLINFEEQITSLKSENETLRKIIEDLESKMKMKNNVDEHLEEMREKYELVRTENHSMTEKLNSLENDLCKSLKENEDLNNNYENKIKESYIQYESLHKENEKLKSEYDMLKLENESLKIYVKGNEDSNNELNQFKSDLENVKREKDTLNNVIKELEDELNTSKKCKESLENDLKESNERKESLENEIKKLVNDKEGLENEMKESNDKKDSIENEFEKLTHEKESLERDLRDSNERKESLENELKELVKNKEYLENDIQEIRRCKDTLENDLKESVQLNETTKQNHLKMKEEIESLMDENESLKAKVEALEMELKYSLKERMECVENELRESLKTKEELLKTRKVSEIQVKELREENELLKASVQTLEAKVIGCVKSYKSIEEGDQTFTEVEVGFQESVNGAGEEPRFYSQRSDHGLEMNNTGERSEGEGTGLGSRYTEIISELNEMNQVIRKRGQKISLMEDTISQKDSELHKLKMQLEEALSKLSSGERELAWKEEQLLKMQSSAQVSAEDLKKPMEELKERIGVLEEENQQLRKNFESDNCGKGSGNQSAAAGPTSGDTQSEVMSTSTISRMEETHRMKELEDTFEERYMKLKSLAIKLKKKLAEQTAEMKTLEEAKQKAVAEKEELAKKNHISTAKNVQILQNEIDRLEDSLENNKKELKEKEKLLLSSAQENSSLKTQLATHDEEQSRISSRIHHLEEQLEGEKSLNESLKGQVTALEKRIGLEEEKLARLEETKLELVAVLEEEKKAKELVAKELEEARQETKKHSLIDLEMKDYERSIEDLTSQVKKKEEIIGNLEYRLEAEGTKVGALNEEVVLLKEQIASESDRAEKFKKSVSDYKTQLGQLRSTQETQVSERERDKDVIESLNQELERRKLEFAELSASSERSLTKATKEKRVALDTVEILEEKLSNSEKEVKELREEVSLLKKDYEAYKVRAQSVLRQKSKAPLENVEQLKLDRDQLSAELDALRLRSHELLTELTAARAETGFLNSDRERLKALAERAAADSAKKEAAHKDAYASLEKRLEDRTVEYQGIIANMSSRTEAASRSFSSQLESEKARYAREVERLESKLEEYEEKIWQMKNHPQSSSSSSSVGAFVKSNGKQQQQESLTHDGVSPLAPYHARKVSQGGSVGYGSEEQRIDVANMIREEGEGSEWVEPNPHRSPSLHQQLYSPPSLEQLINNPLPPPPPQQQQHGFDESGSVHSAAADFASREIAKLESKVSSFESRIHQLTNLLTESEAENAKLTQLSDALKEEIRRASRNENREKHLENNEYLKNVILKFISLKTGDEKFRLVPVMKTLLQLSPEEASKVSIIAKGEDVQNLVPQGWGNYLHLWSGR